MKSYHFCVGGTEKGPISLCARVTARTKVEAVRLLREAMPEEVVEIETRTEFPDTDARIEYLNVYLNVYLNPDFITVKHIDGVSNL